MSIETVYHASSERSRQFLGIRFYANRQRMLPDRGRIMNLTRYGHSLWLIGLWSALACSPLGIPAQVAQPVPDRVLTEALRAGHPFLLYSREGMQRVRRTLIRDFFKARAKEFYQRVTGYYDPDSPWYLGEGPLSEREDFHPLALSEKDFSLYIKILYDTMAFTGIEKLEWAQNGLKREIVRILKDLQEGPGSPRATLDVSPVTKRQAFLLAAGVMAYDVVYSRFDTIDRHDPNNQINLWRNRLSAYCASVNPVDLEADERLVLGTALGSTSLFCASVYQAEWGKSRPFQVSALLPDLYRAIIFTQSGLRGLVADDNRLRISLSELEPLLLLAIPWMESMNRLGYPGGIHQGFYGRIVRAFESLQVPTQSQMIQPHRLAWTRDPWLPRLEALFPGVDPKMYPEKKGETTQQFIPFHSASPVASATSSEDRFQIPPMLQSQGVNINRGGRPIVLREMLERFGYPKKAPPQVWDVTEEESLPEAGWKAPSGLPVPSVWGGVFLLAERDDPNSRGGELWEEFGMSGDSHPYTFFYYFEFPLTGFQPPRDQVLSLYPDWQAAVLTTRNAQGDYLFASQAASAVLILPTYAIDHESFLLADNSKEWRWFHEIPSSTDVVSASSAEEPPVPQVAKGIVYPATPLNTSLFSYWTTYPPAGRTIVIRRHGGGVGSGYTLVAHFPDPGPRAKRVNYVQFSIPENGQGVEDPEVPGLYQVIPPEAQGGLHQPMSFNQWQRQRRAERMSGKMSVPAGILNILFSSEAARRAAVFPGVLGHLLEVELADSARPFFYLAAVDQPGREMFEVKYPTIPLDGLRIIEWKQGIEIIAIKTGQEIKNEFLHTDADLAVVMRDRSMKGLFYLMVNGSVLRCKFSPAQEDYLLLVDAQGRKLTAAWASRHVYTNQPPRSGSVFYAPELIGFECPGTVVKYGLKGRQAVVWDHAPITQR